MSTKTRSIFADSREKDSAVGSYLSTQEVEENQLEACDLSGSKKNLLQQRTSSTKNQTFDLFSR